MPVTPRRLPHLYQRVARMLSRLLVLTGSEFATTLK